MAGWLVEAAQPSSGGSEVGRFFSTLARYLVAPLLHAAALDGRPVADVLAWVKSADRAEAEAILTDAGADAALADLRVTRDWAAETRTGLVATALVLLSVYDDPQVSASAETCDIDAEAILDAAGTLFLVAPLHSQERFRPIFEAMTMQLVRAAQDRAQAGRPVEPGLLLMLDECGTCAPLRQLPQLAATGRGQSIQLVSVWQSLGQVRERYGLQRRVRGDEPPRTAGARRHIRPGDTRPLQPPARRHRDRPHVDHPAGPRWTVRIRRSADATTCAGRPAAAAPRRAGPHGVRQPAAGPAAAQEAPCQAAGCTSPAGK
jgi:Type IV secretory system Conjugative DNA transfer